MGVFAAKPPRTKKTQTEGLPEQLLQMREERRVRWRHRIGPKILRPHPFEPLSVERLDEALPAAADVKRHQEVEVVVKMAGEGERREAIGFDRDSEFFLEL